MPSSVWGNIVFSVTPTILVGLLFWFAMRAIIRSDRTERRAYAKLEAQERAKFEAARTTAAPTTATTDSGASQ